jgi:hypothetical protein
MPEWQSAFNHSARGSSDANASILDLSALDRAAVPEGAYA